MYLNSQVRFFKELSPGHKYFLDMHNGKHDFTGVNRFVRSTKALLFEHIDSRVIHHYLRLTQNRLSTLVYKSRLRIISSKSKAQP